MTSTLADVARQMPAVLKAIDGRADFPADVKSAFDAVRSQLETFTARFAPAGGRGTGGGGRSGAPESLPARIAQAKNGLMGSMPVTAQTADAYQRSKADVPKAIADARAFLATVQTLSVTLARHNITLTVPAAAGATPAP